MKWKEYLELAGFLLVILGLYLVQREIVLNRTIARAELVQETAHNFFEKQKGDGKSLKSNAGLLAIVNE